MKYVLRALKWATIILWICFISLISTIVYSAANVRVKIEEAKTFTEDNKLILAIPFTIINNGLHDISNLNFTTLITDKENQLLAKSVDLIDIIPKNEKTTIWHNISLNIQEIINDQNYIFEDSNFTLLNNVSLNFAGVVPFTASNNLTMPWGAPLYNFTVGEPNFQVVNTTTSIASFNVSFENHSPYINLEGSLKIEIFNENEEPLGMTYETISVPSNSFYEKTLSVYVETQKITSSGHINLTFETSTFSFGPLVIPYGSEE